MWKFFTRFQTSEPPQGTATCRVAGTVSAWNTGLTANIVARVLTFADAPAGGHHGSTPGHRGRRWAVPARPLTTHGLTLAAAIPKLVTRGWWKGPRP